MQINLHVCQHAHVRSHVSPDIAWARVRVSRVRVSKVRQLEKLGGEKYVLTLFLDIHNNNGVQQNNISIDEKYSLGDCQSLYSLGIILLKDIFHH